MDKQNQEKSRLHGTMQDASEATRINGSINRRLFTIEEAAEELRISTWLLYRLIQSNQIPTVTIGTRRFIALQDLVDFINKQRHEEYEAT